MSRRGWELVLVFSLTLTGAAGCSSSTTPYKIGFKLIGKAVDHAEIADLESKLMGRPDDAAISEFGPYLDRWKEIGGVRHWLVFSAKLDPLDKHRYVVESSGGRIAAVSKVERGGANELDIPRRLVLREKVKGKSASDSERELGMGPPVLTAQSDKTGYSAR